jgi:hypothetical protein
VFLHVQNSFDASTPLSVSATDQFRRNGGKPLQMTGARPSGRGPGAGLFGTGFDVCRWYYCLSIVQINPFRPSPSHSATESQPFRHIIRLLAGPPLLGARKKIFFTSARTRLRQPCDWLTDWFSLTDWVHGSGWPTSLHSACVKEPLFSLAITAASLSFGTNPSSLKVMPACSSNYRYLPTGPHGVTTEKAEI